MGECIVTKVIKMPNLKLLHIRQVLRATINARKILVPGDRIRVTRCPGTKRTVTFVCWDGSWIVSRSGINDICAVSIDKLNGKEINITECMPLNKEENNILDLAIFNKSKAFTELKLYFYKLGI